MWAAEILLRMKEQTMYQDVELCLALLSQHTSLSIILAIDEINQP